VGGRKDLKIHEGYQGTNTPLVVPVSKMEEEMYNQMVRLNKQVKLITEILEISNEK
jgi:hypothetical protein